MDKITEIKINRISNYLFAYGAIIVCGLIWNVFDGDIENTKDCIRGVLRVIVASYLAVTIWDLKKTSWWFITIATGFLIIVGFISLVFVAATGAFNEQFKLLTFVLLVVPALAVLIRIFLTAIQKDVKSQFVN